MFQLLRNDSVPQRQVKTGTENAENNNERLPGFSRKPFANNLVSPTRIELVAYRLGGDRSIRLSYGDSVGRTNR